MNNHTAIALGHVSDVSRCYPERHDMTVAHANRGFTLIELLITLSIAMILLTIAVPSFIDFIRNGRMATQTNDLVLALAYAKSEAVKRGITINVCKNVDTTTACSNADTGWSNGWTIFVDSDNDCVVDSTEEVLRVWPALQANTLCYSNGDRVRFGSTGFTTSVSNGTFRVCDARGATEARGVVLSLQGRARRAIDSDNNSIEEDGSGNDLSCP